MKLPDVLKSKRFWSAIASVVAMLIVTYRPEFNGMEAELTDSITMIALLLIGGYTITDTASLWKVARQIAKMTPTTKDDELIAAFGGKSE